MEKTTNRIESDFDPRFKLFHELMANTIRDVLLVSTPYDAWILEEDCRLSERIIHEYRGLNLSHPPRFSWASSAREAVERLHEKSFDMVIAMPGLAKKDDFILGPEIKKKEPQLPVILLSHDIPPLSLESGRERIKHPGVDRTFLWTGNTDLLVALIKNAEDFMNAPHDTSHAGIRVIIFVEDSPVYMSSLLPILYKELVIQTQAVIEQSLNEEHRLLAMRARPKILIAESHEEAQRLYERYEPHVLGVISDVRYPWKGKLNDRAGVALLKKIKEQRFDIPLLLLSSEASNAEKAREIPAAFIEKNSPSFHADVRAFFRDRLGFGDFVFKTPDNRETHRASDLRSFEKLLHEIPDESFEHHCNANDFSRWLFARSEIELATKVRCIRDDDFTCLTSHREHLISIIHARRMQRQKGVVVNFDANLFDIDSEFFKIGTGSLGGKARGLAFFSSLLRRGAEIHDKFEGVHITIPQTLVITTEGFDDFIEGNNLKALSKSDAPDEEIARTFLAAELPKWVSRDLGAYLAEIKYPLAIRSSSLLEDARFRAYAGLYKTYMLPNDHPNTAQRLAHLAAAIKLVYASTWFHGPRAFSRRVGNRTEEEKMAVIVQEMVGEKHGNYFYPAISGVAQSHNYYPFSKMKFEDGIATIALGLGKLVVEGEKTLRFSPRRPGITPRGATVEDVLENAQRYFYALKSDGRCIELGVDEGVTLEKREVSDAADEPPVLLLASTYIPDEGRIRDTTQTPGHRVLTFARALKYNMFPLAGILTDVLKIGERGMGCPVEMEFSVNLHSSGRGLPDFAILQVRPMSAREELMKVEIRSEEIRRAFCSSTHALGNVIKQDMTDIVYIKPDAFDPARTPGIAREIGKINARLLKAGRKYLLIGPGRWGSADPWLGVPVSWAQISGVGAMVEASTPNLKVEPSQGSHFFHNITTLGINYITISDGKDDFIDWTRLQ
ncbi:MAG: hypothetical protein GY859_19600, partial [Desulfobacterales bacterium]|nr:hypothetical protein [Desulfobacterales bacterium]